LSGQSVYKQAYDKYALIHFQSIGWNSHIVNKRGWYCDLIGVRENEIAIIEVKSPAEGSCGQNYNDVKGLKTAQIQDLPTNFQDLRRTIFNGINNSMRLSLIKLFAISIACQLYRYVHEHESLISRYMKAIGNYMPNSVSYHLVPFFVVPIEAQQQADCALIYLKNNGHIFDFSISSTCKQYFIKIDYHRTYIGF